MREIDVHDFHRRVVINGEPALAGLRTAAATITGTAPRPAFGDWSVWNKLSGDTSRVSFTDWGVWNKIR